MAIILAEEEMKTWREVVKRKKNILLMEKEKLAKI